MSRHGVSPGHLLDLLPYVDDEPARQQPVACRQDDVHQPLPHQRQLVPRRPAGLRVTLLHATGALCATNARVPSLARLASKPVSAPLHWGEVMFMPMWRSPTLTGHRRPQVMQS